MVTNHIWKNTAQSLLRSFTCASSMRIPAPLHAYGGHSPNVRKCSCKHGICVRLAHCFSILYLITCRHRPRMEKATHGYALCALAMLQPFGFSRCFASLHPPRQLKLAVLDACPRHAAPWLAFARATLSGSCKHGRISWLRLTAFSILRLLVASEYPAQPYSERLMP